MGASVIQVSLFATLLIVACEMSPRSGGGGGFGGGSGGGSGGGEGFGGGIGGGGGFGGGAGGGNEQSEGGQDESEELGFGDDGGDGSEQGDGEEDGDNEGGEGDEDDESGDEDEDSDEEGSGNEDEDSDEENGQNEDEDEDSNNPGDCGSGAGWGSDNKKGKKSSNRSTASDKRKRSTKFLKSSDMGETSIPTSIWVSGKKAPRDYHYEYYYYDGHQSSNEGEINGPSQDVTNIVAVIPWWFTQFTRGLSLKISPMPYLPRSLLLKHVRGTHSHHLQRREANEMLRTKRDSVDKDITEEEPKQEQEEMETAEENPSEVDNIIEESPAEEITGDSEVGEMAEEIETEVMEEESRIADDLPMDMLMLDPGISPDAVQARAARSMERNSAEVVEDLNVDLKTNVKSSVRTPKSTRALATLDLSKLLQALNGPVLDLNTADTG